MGMALVHDILGIDLFADVIAVDYNINSSPSDRVKITDPNVLSCLKDLPQLQSLDSYETGVTDAVLLHVESLTKLTQLNLTGTKFTKKRLKKLQQELPNCMTLFIR
jgi:hypothetical protein